MSPVSKVRSPNFQQTEIFLQVLDVFHCGQNLFSKIVVGFNFGKFGVIVRLSLEIGVNVKCQEEYKLLGIHFSK